MENIESQKIVSSNYNNLNLKEQKEIHQLFHDKGIIDEMRTKLNKIIFRYPAPTPTEYLDHKNGWITKSFQDSIYDHIKEDFLEILDPVKNYNQVVEYGATRCHAKNERILMYDFSTKYVQDIKLNDLIMGDDGTPRKVLKLLKGKGKLYEVKQNRADNYIVNEDHILVLQYTNRGLRKDRKNKPYKESNKIIEISVKNYLNLSKHRKSLLKGIKPSLKFQYQHIDINPYYLGLWLGDGSSHNTAITTMDVESIKFIKEYAENLNLKVTIQEKNKENKAKTYTIVGERNQNQFKRNNNILFYYLKDNNLLKNKHIPKEYIKNSSQIRLQVLAGLLDSDGHLMRDSAGFEIMSKSKKLADDIVLLSRSLGFRTIIKNVQKSIKRINFTGTYCKITIFGDLSKIPTKLKRKQVITSNIRVNPLRTGVQLYEKGYDDYYGFELDGNNKYLLSDFTITHNTGKSYLARMLIHYVIIYIHCLRHPQLYYGLAPTTNLSIYIMSFVAEKVNQLLLKPIYDILDLSPRFKRLKFQDKVAEEQYKHGLDNIYWSKASTFGNITLESKLTLNLGTDFMSFIGSDLLFLIVSEINFFIEKAGATHEEIFQLYTDGVARIQATVGDNYLGTVFLDSSSNDEDNPIEKYILEELPKQEKVFFRQRAKWVEENSIRKAIGSVKLPIWEETGKTFDICKGNKTFIPKIIEDKTELKQTPKSLIVPVPIDLKGNFKRNILKAIKDDCGLPTRKENKLIQDVNIILNLFENKYINNIESLIYADASEVPENLIWNQIRDNFFSKSNINRYTINRAQGEPRYIGIDLAHAVKGDIQGIAMLHKERSKELQRTIYVTDFCFGVIGKEKGINLEAGTHLVLDLISIGNMFIQGVYIDQFQSQTLIQALQRSKIDAKKQSVDKTLEPYQTLLTFMINNFIKVGKNIFLKNNLDSLITTKRNDKEVIDHTKGTVNNIYNGNFEYSSAGINAKDCSDALCQAFWGAFSDDTSQPFIIYEEENKKYSNNPQDFDDVISKTWSQLHKYY